MRFKEFYLELSSLLNHFGSLATLFARLTLAYGFYEPALMKWSNFDVTVVWFTQLGIPFATFATFLTASVEIIGVVLLALGLFTRIVSIPLMIILLVAIGTVHLGNGFSVANNGFEIPLYYFLFLFFFATHGAGRFSIDYLIFRKEP
ncbi:MAG TPA: DoxX family protein [Campylobacterales bacterium]|nr:DoxX family protein [Campylobacterales bacterium]HIP41283.1 DoxX family protein [Campylobacterales bacterium]